LVLIAWMSCFGTVFVEWSKTKTQHITRNPLNPGIFTQTSLCALHVLQPHAACVAWEQIWFLHIAVPACLKLWDWMRFNSMLCQKHHIAKKNIVSIWLKAQASDMLAFLIVQVVAVRPFAVEMLNPSRNPDRLGVLWKCWIYWWHRLLNNIRWNLWQHCMVWWLM